MENQSKDLIFGLDIGTRTVIGVLGYKDENEFVVMDSEILEHDSRAMIDGQIHDVAKVTESVIEVKQKMEKRNKTKFEDVVIAAAGRALKTYTIKVENNFVEEKIIDSNDIRILELEGIKEAEKMLEKELQKTDTNKYYCVGHSIISYFINDYHMKNLEGQKANKIAAEVIATFLPKVVVDSLYAVMENANLKVKNLTLEPIAAINVAIPKEIRALNLALVDIGAGTSDIAITKEGSVVAYGMISNAGDEITESIMHKYLVPFNEAEKMKLAIKKNRKVTFNDILGSETQVMPKELTETSREATIELAKEIAEKVIVLNANKAPNAVFCVGGGSQTKNLTKYIANELKLSEDRVVVRGNELIKGVNFLNSKLEGPNTITPVGICVTSVVQKGIDFIDINVNNEKVKIMNLGKVKVLDAVMAKGYDHTNLIGRRGKSIEFLLDGRKIKVLGTHGEPAKIIVNGEDASLETKLSESANIKIKRAKSGEKGKAFVTGYIDRNDMKKVFVNTRMINTAPHVTINGELVSIDKEINDKDVVEIFVYKTLRELFLQHNISTYNKKIYVNGVLAEDSYRFMNDDSIEIKEV